MALRDRINNAKQALADAKIRMVVIILIVIVVITLIITYIKFRRAQLPPAELASSVIKAPEITSIPGMGQPTREYAKLQEQQNLELAEEAARKGTSAIPTVVRTTYLDVGVSSDLAEKSGAASTTGCSAEELKQARLAGVNASELRCRGCSLASLKTAEYTAGELKNTGSSANSLRDAGFNEEEIKAAGFSSTNLSSSGDCSIQKIREARGKGASATELKKLGCSAIALKAAGFSAAELRAAGFSAGELRDAGFSAKELKDAGFSARELKAAGFSATELKDFTPDELKSGGYTDGDLARAGIKTIPSENLASECGIDNIKKARASGFSAAQLKATRDCSNRELKAAGFNDDEIKAAIVKLATTAEPTSIPLEPQKPLGQLSKEQMANMTTQELEDLMRQQQALIRQQANDLISAWTQIPSQQYVQGEAPPQSLTKGKESSAAALKDVDVYKAGTIIFATLDSEVNSDENTPVMATVVQGPLKGSKLLGNLQRVDKKVLLQFSVMSVPKLINSISVNAVAIDPNTAKTALASKVDNHYMLRYGTLLATSFASGLSEAIQGSGGQIQVSSLGTTATFPQIDFQKQLLVALGKMGKQIGTAMGPNINMPPTVKVNAGSSIGLLLIADLSVPKAGTETVST